MAAEAETTTVDAQAATATSELELGLLPRAKPAVFSSPFELAMAETRAQLGDALVNLASGDPDISTPPHITAAAVASINRGEHHYTPKNGLPALRAAISAHIDRAYNLQYSPDEICVTAGVQEGLASCFLALCTAGDEVLVPSPTYLSYGKQTAMLGGATLVNIPCKADNDFVVDPIDIESRITPRSKVLVHVSPK
eukprot:SAG31_NODE_12375_length_946_cov_1.211334_1_plen_196_part_00